MIKKYKPGSVQVQVDEQGNQALCVYQEDGTWAVRGSAEDLYSLYSDDLTNNEEDGKIQGMAKSLIPHAETWLDAELNVLLIGLHGTGKTESIKQLADERGLNMKYFSCSTLDPFTDLVGVPVPCDLLDADGKPVLDANGSPVQTLKMVRPHEIDQAEIIFFDELNRADAKTLNAVFEIIQFQSLNGEPLPNLKCCWGAINPPDEDYDVERLDAALLDRFDLYIPIDPKPSVSYMTKMGLPQPIAKALHNWYSEHQVDIRKGIRDVKVDYISPRRLMKIGLVWMASPQTRSIKFALPSGGNFDVSKLTTLLRAAQANVDKGIGLNDAIEEDEDGENAYGEYQGQPLGDQPWEGINYKLDWIKLNSQTVVDFLEASPNHYETHNAVQNLFLKGIGGPQIVQGYAAVVNALQPSVVEGLVNGFPEAKKTMMRNAMKEIQQSDPTGYAKLTTLKKVLDPQGKGLVP